MIKADSGTSSKFNELLFGLLSTFPENFIYIIFSNYFANRQTDWLTHASCPPSSLGGGSNLIFQKEFFPYGNTIYGVEHLCHNKKH